MPAGRPRKFDEPSSPVTMTLPARILQQLKKIDSDRGKAIVKCVDEITAKSLGNEKRVEIVKVSNNSGLIVIGRCRCLESISWLRLVEIAPTRFMLSIARLREGSATRTSSMHLPSPTTGNCYERRNPFCKS